ncbi:MAG TPA: ferrous iron transporter B [Bacillota bacterium]|nr:ferrous iron transporter B [Clostridiales bacterium]HPT85655.1 ferrous iron transporter B [Bacillota bacterium]
MDKSIKIALAGNPNSGKTTLFNALTGSNQFVGNWPGVTVEKKEGKLKKHEGVTVTDLPGIYSLSPYTLEEVVARNYLVNERPDAILNIVDGTNLERNLYLTTQLLELGIPVVVAINMMDAVRKRGDKIDTRELSRALGCKVVEISALKGEGIDEAARAAIEAAQSPPQVPRHTFSGTVEHALAHIEEAVLHDLPAERQRWYAIKIFERDEKVLEQLALPDEKLAHIEEDIKAVEAEFDDDAESIITNERYVYIAELMKACYKKKSAGKASTSDKIDRVVTNRILALPIFAIVMFVVYFISVTTVGAWATDWANDGVFGDGWHLFGIGAAEYEEAAAEYGRYSAAVEAFEAAAEAEGLDPAEAEGVAATALLYDDEGNIEEEFPVDFAAYKEALGYEEPDPADYGVWVPGVPALVGGLLERANVAPWLEGLIMDGIVGGVGAVLGFVPQMLVLFFLLAFLEACGYMARVAFVMDRIFRKFNLSGKSFIPMLIATGCGVPGVMASRTIENERDRRMTIMTTTFMPCGAKLPIIALIAGAMFGGAWWVAPSAYFVGIAAVIVSGIMLKKTPAFAGDPAPFVMELPEYRLPTLGNLLRSMWERAWSFIKKAGTVILLSSILLWVFMSFGFEGGRFGLVESLENSILAKAGGAVAWIFAPLGFGSWQATVATFTGLIAKENVVGTFGVLYGGMEEVAENGWQVWQSIRAAFTPLTAYSFLLFNLLCAPCFAAIGAIRREMNSARWTLFAIGYQTLFAYAVSLMVYQFGMLFAGSPDPLGLAAAAAVFAFMMFMLFKPEKGRPKLSRAGAKA